ncbi:MAG TPA: hypothetical protein VI485_13530 [Vicinamibacterales bacterium]|nr:hypothetical protein [Vicinamibacterales bacterium]
MSVAIGAWLAAVAGGLTGVLEGRLRPRTSPRSSVLAGAVGGAVIGALAYGAFVVAGFAVSLLTFSSAPDPWPALLCVIIGCATLLVLRTVHSAVAPRFGMPQRRSPSEPRTFEDLIKARPRGGPSTMWLGGVGLASLPLIYGISCVVTRRGELGTMIWPSEVQGAPAIALGVGWIGVGLFLHFHFFFGLHHTLAEYSRRGKSIALIVAGLGLTVAGAWSVFAQVSP